jgi:hypothetical protein
MRLAAGCLVIVLGLASACGGTSVAAGPAPDVESHLSCAGGLRESMVVDHGGTERETRTPEQMAKDYGDHVGGAFSGQRKVVYRSAERIDITFSDSEGRVQAVLSYGLDEKTGWLLQNGVNCA